MKAVFLEDIEIDDGKHKPILVNKGDIWEVESEYENDYILRRKDGTGTVAPKSAEGNIFRIEDC